MLFKLNVYLTEDDYFAFNQFHSVESIHGKKTIRKTRFLFCVLIVILAAMVLLLGRRMKYSLIFVAVLLLFSLLYMMFFKKLIVRSVKSQIKQLKKMGKLPFDPASTYEFYEDKMVETAPSGRVEQGYQTLERICVVDRRYVLLYKSSVVAHILPMAQIEEQLNIEEFLTFLKRKCPNVEYY